MAPVYIGESLINDAFIIMNDCVQITHLIISENLVSYNIFYSPTY